MIRFRFAVSRFARFVLGQVALLVLFAAAAPARIVASRLDWGRFGLGLFLSGIFACNIHQRTADRDVFDIEMLDLAQALSICKKITVAL